MIGPGKNIAHGQLRLIEPATTSISITDQYKKISGNFANGDSVGFSIDNNKITYNGYTRCFLFNGSSDLEVNQACEIYYALFKNNELVSDAQTPHVFVSPSKTSNISITSIIRLKSGDVLDVFTKSDKISTDILIKTFNITFWSH